LTHGAWKGLPNHVERADGSLLEYAPPERVQDEVERLVELYADSEALHPLVRAAWLHYAFIRIHPFEDGNGRVARALTLLELLRARYAPLVVDRQHREEYILALDQANDGDLEPFIRFLAEQERRSMVRQFQAPLQRTAPGMGVLEVARSASAKLVDLQEAAKTERAARIQTLAGALHERVIAYLSTLRPELETTFKSNDTGARVRVSHDVPGGPHGKWWGAVFVNLANAHDFYANLRDGTWWTTLDLAMLNERMRFVTGIVKVGAGETGVATLICVAERPLQSDEARQYEWLIKPGAGDQVTMAYDQTVEELWEDAEDLLERSLSAGIAEFTRRLT
jgi:prophage maintenance system killer protein